MPRKECKKSPAASMKRDDMKRTGGSSNMKRDDKKNPFARKSR